MIATAVNILFMEPMQKLGAELIGDFLFAVCKPIGLSENGQAIHRNEGSAGKMVGGSRLIEVSAKVGDGRRLRQTRNGKFGWARDGLQSQLGDAVRIFGLYFEFKARKLIAVVFL